MVAKKRIHRLMKTHFDIEKIVQNGTITNGLDYERALVADKKLRLLAMNLAQIWLV